MKRLKALRKIIVSALCCARNVEKDEDNFDDIDVELVRKTWIDQRDFINKLMDECLLKADNITNGISMKDGSPFDSKFAKFWFQIRVEACKSVWWPAAYPWKHEKFVDAQNIAPYMMKCMDSSSAAAIREWYGLATFVTTQYLDFYKLRPR